MGTASIMLCLQVCILAAWFVNRCSGYHANKGWFPAGDSCYFVSGDKAPFLEAQAKCVSIGMDLVDIEDMTENQNVANVVLRGETSSFLYWIGLSSDDNALFTWASDGRELDGFTLWKYSSDASRASECVGMYQAKWSTRDCDDDNPYVCERKNTEASCPCGFAQADNGQCYYFEPATKYDGRSLEWGQAKDICTDLDSHLLAISGNEELGVVIQAWETAGVDDTDYWIGYMKRSGESDFRWEDGSTSDWENWKSNEPDLQGNGCHGARISFSVGEWKAERCNTDIIFICEKGQIPVAPPTTIAPSTEETTQSSTEFTTHLASTTRYITSTEHAQTTAGVTGRAMTIPMRTTTDLVTSSASNTTISTSVTGTAAIDSTTATVAEAIDSTAATVTETINSTAATVTIAAATHSHAPNISVNTMFTPNDTNYSQTSSTSMETSFNNTVEPTRLTSTSSEMSNTSIGNVTIGYNTTVSTVHLATDWNGPNISIVTTTQSYESRNATTAWAVELTTQKNASGGVFEQSSVADVITRKVMTTLSTTIADEITTEKILFCGTIPSARNATHNATHQSNNSTFPVGTLVIYTCSDNTSFPDGATTRHMVCSAEGRWSLKETPACIGEPIVVTQRLVQPIPVEAPAAAAIGSVGLFFIIGIVAGIILLDATALNRHLRRMKRNLGYTTETYRPRKV